MAAQHSWNSSFAVGVVLLSIGCAVLQISPLGVQLEEELGLYSLFQLRGPHPAPADVTMITIDEDSVSQLGLPDKVHQWPRTIHAELIQRLHDYGASTIVLDIAFMQPSTPAADQRLADAIREAGNVALFKFLTRPQFHNQSLQDPATQKFSIIQAEREVPPLPILRDSAAAIASFVLPKRPVRVNQAWLYKLTPSGLEASMPLMALQLYTHEQRPLLLELLAQYATTDDLQALLASQTHEVEFARNIHQLLTDKPELSRAILNNLPTRGDDKQHQALIGLINGYRQQQGLYINFYGPRHSVQAVAYHQIIDDSLSADALAQIIQNKAVFVGLSEQQQTKQADYYYTVFSEIDGNDISGVEIAATVFANLLENRYLKPLKAWQQLLLILAWSCVLILAAQKLPLHYWLISTIVLSCGYCLLSYLLFTHSAIWLPMVVGLLLLTPGLSGLVIWRRYQISRDQRETATKILYRYLPAAVATEMQQNILQLQNQRKLVQGICLLSDISNYTHYAETAAPDQLHGIMNEYYRLLSECIRQHGGFVINIVGDSLLALWTADQITSALKQQACAAAMAILDAVDDYNTQHAGEALITCIGMHAGEISLGNLGSHEHYEYAPVGDTVNTTARIEAYNRVSGTRILISDRVQNELNGFVTRPLGQIVLKGKTQTIRLYELIGPEAKQLYLQPMKL